MVRLIIDDIENAMFEAAIFTFHIMVRLIIRTIK